MNEYAVEPTTTYATETYAYVGDKFVSTKDYTYETYDSAKTCVEINQCVGCTILH